MRQFHKLHDVKLFGRIEHIDQIMRNASHLLRADFGRSDIHMAVDLHGIRGDNGPIYRFGKRNRQLRLTDSGRTGQDNQRFFQKNHLHNSLKFLFQFPFREGNDRRPAVRAVIRIFERQKLGNELLRLCIGKMIVALYGGLARHCRQTVF